MIKLFNRLYDPTGGEISVDGLPLTSYVMDDIRRSMAILRQEHVPYPVSLLQNVALGHPDCDPTDTELEEAIRQGGAHTFIEKLPNKLNTVLDPVPMTDMCFRGKVIDELKKIIEEKGKVTDISGGESQRLAA